MVSLSPGSWSFELAEVSVNPWTWILAPLNLTSAATLLTVDVAWPASARIFVGLGGEAWLPGPEHATIRVPRSGTANHAIPRIFSNEAPPLPSR